MAGELREIRGRLEMPGFIVAMNPRQRYVTGGLAVLLLLIAAWSAIPRGGREVRSAPEKQQVGAITNADLVRNLEKLPTTSAPDEDGRMIPGVANVVAGQIQSERAALENVHAQRILAEIAESIKRRECLNVEDCATKRETLALQKYRNAAAAGELWRNEVLWFELRALQLIREQAVDGNAQLAPATLARVMNEWRSRLAQQNQLEQELQAADDKELKKDVVFGQ
jgi:hypothetical protein